MLNRVQLIGNLGQDPELRTTNSGSTVATLRLATTSRKKDQAGQWTDQTEWHSVVAFGRTAENAGQYLRKGRQVYVEGRLQTRKWQDKEGRDRWTTEVVCNELKFLGGKDGGSQGGGSRDPSYRGGGSYGGGGGSAPYGNDDIPF